MLLAWRMLKERGAPMELWQMDVVGGFVLADGRRAKALTGVDDHSRFCISARLMLRETSQRVCEGLALALRTWGVPGQILTDNGIVVGPVTPEMRAGMLKRTEPMVAEFVTEVGRDSQEVLDAYFAKVGRWSGIRLCLPCGRPAQRSGSIRVRTASCIQCCPDDFPAKVEGAGPGASHTIAAGPDGH